MRSWLIGFVVPHLFLAIGFNLPYEALNFSLPIRVGATVFAILALLRQRLRWTSGMICGLLLAIPSWHHALDTRLPVCVREDHWSVQAVVDRIVRRDMERTQFTAQIVESTANSCADINAVRVRVSWYGASDLQEGEIWRFVLRLSPPWGYANPGGFDYERWLLGSEVQGTGYVVSGKRIGFLDHSKLESEIFALRAWIKKQLVERDRRGLYRALSIGDTSTISQQTWELLRRTGTVHLLVISGLHVGLMTMLGFFLGSGLSRLSPWLCLRWGTSIVGAFSGILISGAFVVISGSQPPALRAWIMSSLAALALSWGRRIDAIGLWWLALGIVLVLQPLAILHSGFWLSFAAVGFLLFRFLPTYRSTHHYWHELFNTQITLALALTPLVAFFVGAIPVGGVLVNLIAVPWVTLMMVPLLILYLLISAWVPVWSSAIGTLLDFCTDQLMHWLILMQSFPQLGVPEISAIQLFLTVLAGVMLLRHPSRRQTILLLLGWTLWLSPRSMGIPTGEFRVLSLDVGQGTAVLIDTAKHRLLYDTGLAFPSGFNSGNAVILPALRATGPERLDMLILSHGDADHVGGVEAIVARIKPTRLLAGGTIAQGQPCAEGDSWRWDGVQFEILYPPAGLRIPGNNGSCVLRITGGGGTALLTGDIEQSAERSLLHTKLRSVDLLIAPHHGSKTSSSMALVRRLQPRVVHFTAARFSRYGHPAPVVLTRYKAQSSAITAVTGKAGALLWTSMEPGNTSGWRYRYPRIWHTVDDG